MTNTRSSVTIFSVFIQICLLSLACSKIMVNLSSNDLSQVNLKVHNGTKDESQPSDSNNTQVIVENLLIKNDNLTILSRNTTKNLTVHTSIPKNQTSKIDNKDQLPLTSNSVSYESNSGSGGQTFLDQIKTRLEYYNQNINSIANSNDNFNVEKLDFIDQPQAPNINDPNSGGKIIMISDFINSSDPRNSATVREQSSQIKNALYSNNNYGRTYQRSFVQNSLQNINNYQNYRLRRNVYY